MKEKEKGRTRKKMDIQKTGGEAFLGKAFGVKLKEGGWKMREDKVRNIAEFRLWVKIRLVEEEISQRELARQMDIPHARISEATHGKQAGTKFIVPIIKNLNGDLDNFKEFLDLA